MNNINLIDYDNWYVLQTVTRNEFQIKNKIDRLFNKHFNMLIPLRQLLHNKNGDLVKTLYPLFPGYIFLHNVPLSTGLFHKGDNVKILYGPLKNFKGTILFINKKKHKAKVRIKLFNREVDTILGLNMIKIY